MPSCRPPAHTPVPSSTLTAAAVLGTLVLAAALLAAGCGGEVGGRRVVVPADVHPARRRRERRSPQVRRPARPASPVP